MKIKPLSGVLPEFQDKEVKREYSACDVYGGRELIVAKFQDMVAGAVRRAGYKRRKKYTGTIVGSLYPSRTLEGFVRHPEKISGRAANDLRYLTGISLDDALVERNPEAVRYWRKKHRASLKFAREHPCFIEQRFREFMVLHVVLELDNYGRKKRERKKRKN